MERRMEGIDDRFELDEMLINQQRTANVELATRVVRNETDRLER